MKKTKNPIVIALVAFITVCADQITKILILKNPNFYGVDPDFFQIKLIYNTGVAFGIPIKGIIYYIILLILTGILIHSYKKYLKHNYYSFIIIGLIIGGGIGNLIDKLFRIGVIDFIKVGPWPLFNIADSAITIGVILAIIFQKQILIETH